MRHAELVSQAHGEQDRSQGSGLVKVNAALEEKKRNRRFPLQTHGSRHEPSGMARHRGTRIMRDICCFDDGGIFDLSGKAPESGTKDEGDSGPMRKPVTDKLCGFCESC